MNELKFIGVISVVKDQRKSAILAGFESNNQEKTLLVNQNESEKALEVLKSLLF